MTFATEQVKCTKCDEMTDSLAVFPGKVCLACWDRMHGNDPLTEQGLKQLTATFRNPLRRR